MKITKEYIESLKPCKEGYDWYVAQGSEDLLETLLKVNEAHSDWSRWLFTRLMSVKQNRMIAAFAADQVLHIYEEKVAEDLGPRKAIEAARAVIENDNQITRSAASAAWPEAAESASAAWPEAAESAAWSAAARSETRSAAWWAAWSAASAAWAAAASAAEVVAESASAAARSAAESAVDLKKIQEVIIKEAVRILEEEK